MGNAGLASPVGLGKTVVLVINAGAESLLCPFFEKCDGVLLIDADGRSREFHPRDHASGKSLCDLILELQPRRCICGFIGESEKHKLRAAGIDVRLGSCNCSVHELLASFSSLPKA